MKPLILAALALSAGAGHAQTPARDYLSCNLADQRAVRGDVGGSITDERQAHVSVRSNVLQADIGNARKARRLTQSQADTLWKRVDVVRRGADGYTRKQGFLSAAERASYDRELDAVAARICR